MAESIVVGTDGSDHAERAVEQAIDIAARDGARLHIVTVYPDPAMFRERIASGATSVEINLRGVAENIGSRFTREAEKKGVEVVTDAREGDPADVILDVAKEVNADLIVVGSRGLSPVRRFLLGSVSAKVTEHARCNVMVVRGD